jgi:hypothetical protein
MVNLMLRVLQMSVIPNNVGAVDGARRKVAIESQAKRKSKCVHYTTLYQFQWEHTIIFSFHGILKALQIRMKRGELGSDSTI